VLNARRGSRMNEFKVGDHVAAWFVPPRDRAPLDEKRWKQKHMIAWRGPCKVLARKSNATYRLMDVKTKKTFDRHVALLARWRPTVDPLIESKAPERERRVAAASAAEEGDDFGDLVAGETVAVVDHARDKRVYLMKVVSVSDEMVDGHYYGTMSDDFARAKFNLTYIEQGSGLSILRQPRRHEKADAWTGSVPLEFVRARNITFRSDHALDAKSRRKLEGYTAKTVG
jgi:hypothetical protein